MVVGCLQNLALLLSPGIRQFASQPMLPARLNALDLNVLPAELDGGAATEADRNPGTCQPAAQRDDDGALCPGTPKPLSCGTVFSILYSVYCVHWHDRVNGDVWAGCTSSRLHADHIGPWHPPHAVHSWQCLQVLF
jgi:hypothetical protein